MNILSNVVLFTISIFFHLCSNCNSLPNALLSANFKLLRICQYLVEEGEFSCMLSFTNTILLLPLQFILVYLHFLFGPLSIVYGDVLKHRIF